MSYDLIENTLKSMLLTDIKIMSRKRVLGTGKVQLFEIKDFNIKLIFDNGKKVEILYPFNIHKKDKFIFFDYTLKYIHQDDIILQPQVNRMIKNTRNKYFDLLLSIERI
tara:strand:- start:139 stop:465 length:327 start_codon:yes stop_codon:yes gene_type:complete